MAADVDFSVNGTPVVVADDGCSLLEALRDRLGVRSPKDGCSPQGQCGCCTVLVDGQPRVSCVTPVGRVRGRVVTTVEGLDSAPDWAACFAASGASQCGFCTPGIICRLEPLRQRGELSSDSVRHALLAHLCRCTGWQPIVEAACAMPPVASSSLDRGLGVTPSVGSISGDVADAAESRQLPRRDGAPVSAADRAASSEASARRALLEGGVPQRVDPVVALGGGGFSDDHAPLDALVAVRSSTGEWLLEDSLVAARRATGKVQGRRTTVAPSWPIEIPDGEWVRVLQTTWVEPAYLETDAAWCAPGGAASSPLANGGAFGGKVASPVVAAAEALAASSGVSVRALWSREDVVRFGPKRPPMAIGVRTDGTGIVRVARTAGIAATIRTVAPGFVVEEVDVDGPSTSSSLRGAGWVEAAVVLSSLQTAPDTVVAPNGSVASATIDDDGVHVRVRCGAVLDPVVLRSYCIGAAHMALGWVRSERLSVDPASGEVLDLTIRSFGIIRAVDMPHVDVEFEEPASPSKSQPVNGSDAVFAAVAAAAWRAAGHGPRWPI